VKRLLRALALAGLLAGAAGPANACAICLSAVPVTGGDRLDGTDRAVLATADVGGLRVVAVVKGTGAVGETIALDLVVPQPEPVAGGALLLAHNALADTWTSLGATDPGNADWLAALAGSSGEARLTLAARRLEDADALVAALAHDTIASSPYAAMATIADELDPARLRALAFDAAVGARRATYTLLLGLSGSPDDAAAIEQALGDARLSGDATLTAALLAADLELRGAERVAWVEETYIADPARTVPEIEAALLALAVHGEADRTIPRERVVSAYRRFIALRPRMAGFVAPDLSKWRAWEASTDYAALIAAGDVSDPAQDFAILSFLRESPEAGAREAVEAMLATGACVAPAAASGRSLLWASPAERALMLRCRR
jgi:hypothetical protein